MRLWARCTARRQARQAARQTRAAQKLPNRMAAPASLQRALALRGAAVGALHVHYDLSGHAGYPRSLGTHGHPDVSGSCGGMGGISWAFLPPPPTPISGVSVCVPTSPLQRQARNVAHDPVSAPLVPAHGCHRPRSRTTATQTSGVSSVRPASRGSAQRA